MANLAGNKIKDTFNKLLQLDNGIIQNGTGSTVSATINSLTASNGFQGNLEGTASFTYTSSYATTASYATNAQTSSYTIQTLSSSYAITSSITSNLSTLNQDVTISGSLAVTTNITGSGLMITGSTSNDLVRITQNGSGNSLVVEDTNNPDTTPFVVDTNGNVGMGTLTPGNVLHVKANPSSTQTATIRIESGNSTSNSSIAYYSGGINRWEVGTGIALGAPYEIYDRVGGQTRFSITTSGAAVFPSGNVGVGVTSPTEKLEISGAIKIQSGGYTNLTNGATTPVPTGGAGTMVFDTVNLHFFGWNGTSWRQLNN